MKKRLIGSGLIILLGLGAYLYMYRPLPFEIVDPGEEYFTLPDWQKPSGFEQLNDLFPEENSPIEGIIMIDKKVQKGDYYTRGVSGYIMSIDDRVFALMSGDVYGVVDEQHKKLMSLIETHGLHLPAGYTHEQAIFRARGVQARTRVANLKAAQRCLIAEDFDEYESCGTRFAQLLHMARELQYGGSLTQTLIGVRMEQITLNHINYVATQGELPAKVLHRYFSNQNFMATDEIHKTTLQQEYHLTKNLMKKVDEMTTKNRKQLIMNNRLGVDETSPLGFFFSVLPGSWMRNFEESQMLARHAFRLVIEKDYTKLEVLENPYKGKNWFGYMIVSGLVPRMDGIHERIKKTHESNEFINH